MYLHINPFLNNNQTIMINSVHVDSKDTLYANP
jgi:hypothetical protein